MSANNLSTPHVLKSIIVLNPTPSINTGLLATRSLTGVDKPDGLFHKKSQPGRQTVSLFPQLEAHLRGPMGPAGNSRVSSGAYSDPASDEAPSEDTVLHRGTSQNNTGSLRPPSQGGSSGNPAVPGKFHFPDFPGSKKKGRAEASNRQSISRWRVLPDLIQSQDWMVKLE